MLPCILCIELFSSAVPRGIGAFQMPACPSSVAASSSALSTLRGGGGGVRWFIGDFTLTAQYFASSLSVDSETDGHDSLLTNSMQTYGR